MKECACTQTNVCRNGGREDEKVSVLRVKSHKIDN